MGNIVLSSGGAVVDITENATVTGNTLSIVSQSGVDGVFSGEGGGYSNVFRADVATVSIANHGGEVRFADENTVTIDHLGNNGDIAFQSRTGDIIINNQRVAPYVGGDDANTAGGISNANYNIGSLSLSAPSGDIIAIGPYTSDEPDIVALNASLIAQNYGTRTRPLNFYVQNSLYIGIGRSYGNRFYLGPPREIIDESNRQPGIFDNYGDGGEQLVEVEELEEIDPAIFTAVNNYFFDDVSIRLPEDQLYEDELEELASAE